ncbi:MAG: D-beta-D-heptose 7-phosphate kinase / D-beta-D-heptose 1-phosphate adenosyltransferase [Patescibacteria group bacterium]|nr:D-beta-D-heptose 7-phosphate kinase / D-beta-D-heptose 1-phosphate adenosyltransferase [Patescibacteria group bacterium]
MITQIQTYSQQQKSLKSVDFPSKTVLIGGCFDMLHHGHEAFIKAAANSGDFLVLILESDKDIQKRKGPTRPVQTQELRAKKIAELGIVNVVICLPPFMTDKDYENIVSLVKPAIIATTKGDPYRTYKELHAQKFHADVIDVIERLPEFSTTDTIKNI